MLNASLKLLVWQVVEQWLRTDALLDRLAESPQAPPKAMIQQLRTQAFGAMQPLREHEQALASLFRETVDGEASANADEALLPLLDDLVYRPHKALGELQQRLASIALPTVLPETTYFLTNACPLRSLEPSPERLVVVNSTTDDWTIDEVLVEHLDVLHTDAPLQWAGLCRGYTRRVLSQNRCLQEFQARLQKSLSGAQAKTLIADILAVRVLGPAYMFWRLSQALLYRDAEFLAIGEPTLFLALQHFGFGDTQLVIHHEALEKYRQALIESFLVTSTPAMPEQALLLEIFKAAEIAIPTSVAMHEKYWAQAKVLQNRLAESTLMSASCPYERTEVADCMRQNLLRDDAGADNAQDFAIYEPLAMMSEDPATSRAILNAGWLQRVQRLPMWLYSVLKNDSAAQESASAAAQPQPASWQRVKALLLQEDRLLLKSLETAEVHRVLLSKAVSA